MSLLLSPLYTGVVAILLYAMGTLIQILSWKTNRPMTGFRRGGRIPSLLFAIAVSGIALHALNLYQLLFHSGSFPAAENAGVSINLGIYIVADLIGWVLALLVLIACLWQPVQSLFLLAFPVAILGIMAGTFAQDEAGPVMHLSPGLVTHILLSIMAYTILMIAAFQSIVLALQEKMLRNKSRISVLRRLPPLQTMEAVLFQFLWIGLIMLTLSIASGFVFLDNMFAQHVVHHTVLALVSWAVFVSLLIGRRVFGWRGTTAAQWTLVGFGILVVAYFGSKFVLEILLGSTR